jgi:hypothetical protein
MLPKMDHLMLSARRRSKGTQFSNSHGIQIMLFIEMCLHQNISAKMTFSTCLSIRVIFVTNSGNFHQSRLAVLRPPTDTDWVRSYFSSLRRKHISLLTHRAVQCASEVRWTLGRPPPTAPSASADHAECALPLNYILFDGSIWDY